MSAHEGDKSKPRRTLGGIIHTYLGYTPSEYPSPTAPPPDMASAAFEHMMRYGSARRLTPEELADAVKIDPSQIAGLGPSLDAIRRLLEERKAKILATYETEAVQRTAERAYREGAERVRERADDREIREAIDEAVVNESPRQMRKLWYRVAETPEGEQSPVAVGLLHLMETLGERYQVEDLAAKYHFTGRTDMDVPKALEVKQELETIDKLLEQLEEAMKNAKIAVIDLDELREFVEDADVEQLQGFQKQVEEMMREEARRQGLEEEAGGGYRLTPKAYKLFQGKLLSTIFSDLQAARSGRHAGPIAGEGAVELPTTKAYEFGDSAANMDIPQSFTNALIRQSGVQMDNPGRLTLRPEDIEIHRTRNTPKCATAVIMDMSGSMRHGGQYVDAKRMGLALDGLIRSEYPGDRLFFFEMYSIAKLVPPGGVVELMPKPVTIRQPVVRLRADLSDPNVTEEMLPPHFTNIQHALRLSRQMLSHQDTPNRQIMLITDGLPTAHFEGEHLYLLYPPDPLTESATRREALACKREGITINIFLIPSWSQSSEDVQFAHRVAQHSGGRVFFTGGDDLDRFVLWDYVKHRRSIIG